MESQQNPLEKYKDLVPSRAELAALSLLAPTQAERDAAARLLAVVPEEKDREHPLTVLNRLYPEGGREELLARQSPMGRLVEQICAGQPLENQPEDFEAQFTEAFEEILAQKPPPATPALPPEIEDLAARTSLANTIRSHGIEGPKIVHRFIGSSLKTP
jgi:hypothetical protein